MERSVYKKMAWYEERHWLLRGKYDIVRSLLKRASPPGYGSRLLDAGCATGSFAVALERIGYQVTGLDVDASVLQYAKERGLSCVAEGDLQRLPFPDGSFDVVLALDIIEHLPDDKGAIREIARVLSEKGVLIATVPAHQILFNKNDKLMHHQRRYSRASFAETLSSALRVDRISFFNTILSPLIFPAKLIFKTFPSLLSSDKNELDIAPWLNPILYQVFRWEAKFIANHDFPVGLSLIAVARKMS